MECLLSYIEMSQFVQHAVQCSKLSVDSKEFVFIEFAENVPRSDIVEKNQIKSGEKEETERSIKMMAHELYGKYIRVHSEFQINISSRQRQRAAEMLENVDVLVNNTDFKVMDAVKLMEAARKEMLQYLQYSFERFKQRPEWTKVESDVK